MKRPVTHRNFAPPISDGVGLYLTAIRPSVEAAKEFVADLQTRLQRRPQTANLYGFIMIGGSSGTTFVWLREK